MIASHKPPQGELFLPDSGAQSLDGLTRFRSDASLRIEAIDGDLPAYMDCSADDLLEHGWHPFLHPGDWNVIDQMGRELLARQAAHYHVRVVSRAGERLHLAVRTLLVYGGDATVAPAVAGVLDLRHWESSRRYIDLGSNSS